MSGSDVPLFLRESLIGTRGFIGYVRKARPGFFLSSKSAPGFQIIVFGVLCGDGTLFLMLVW